MFATVLLNGLMGLAAIITYCYVVIDIESQIVQSHAVFPWIDVFSKSLRSPTAAVGMTTPIVVVAFAEAMNSLAVASRQAWAFARDDAVPFSRLVKRTTRINGDLVPLHATVRAFHVSLVK